MIVARKGDNPPVLLDWKNGTAEALYNLEKKPSELMELAAVIDKHAAKDALILSWWDTARQIKLLTGRDTLFSNHRLSKPTKTNSGAIPPKNKNKSTSSATQKR